MIDLKACDSIDEGLDEDVLFRTKAFKQFSSNSQRGSSKVVCSLISVRILFIFFLQYRPLILIKLLFFFIRISKKTIYPEMMMILKLIIE